jgi:hypothetical protein
MFDDAFFVPSKPKLTIADVVRLCGFTARHWRKKAVSEELIA